MCVCSCARARHYYELTHREMLPWILRSEGRGSFCVSLKVTGSQRGSVTQTEHVNMCRKGHLRLHTVAQHPLASPHYLSNHSQGISDAVSLLLEGFLGTAV